MVKTQPGHRIYSEMSYNPGTNSWLVFGRDEMSGQSSTLQIPHPMGNSSLDWRTYHQDASTHADLFAVSEPHQVSNPATQMPPIHNFEFSVVGKTSALPWQGGQGSAKVVQQGRGTTPTLVDMDLSWRAQVSAVAV
jgi:hypothetical protein